MRNAFGPQIYLLAIRAWGPPCAPVEAAGPPGERVAVVPRSSFLLVLNLYYYRV